MHVVLTILGAVIVVLGARDMYHSLLHPSGKGAISDALMAVVWRLSRRFGHRFRSAVGPGAMVAVVLVWVMLQSVGWALIYVPHIPAGFVYTSGIDATRYNQFLEALYVSLVTLATLGFGDVVAIDPWIRMVAPLEALAGFALLTSALAWFTRVFPPLSRRRALALDLKGLADTGYADQLTRLNPIVASRVVETLAREIGKASVDFIQHTETYYFHEVDQDLSLARQLPYALVLREAAASCQAPELQAAARLLSCALDQLGAKLQEDFVTTGGDLKAVLTAYAADHGLNSAGTA
jgi:hypothetical protein